MYMFGCKEFMANEKTSILLSDVSIEGEVVEKDKIIRDYYNFDETVTTALTR